MDPIQNIVKLYYNKEFNEIFKYIISRPELFSNIKYIYIRANTEFKLKNYEDSYISFNDLINNYKLNSQQFCLIKEKSFNCLKQIKNNTVCKMTYENMFVQLPVNFGWIFPGILSAMTLPDNKEQLLALKFYNIKYIVNLTNEHIIIDKLIDSSDFIHIHYDIESAEHPTVEQTDEFIDLVNKCKNEKQGIVVICDDGLSKTGILIACYLLIQDKEYQQMAPKDAIEKIRNLREGSIGNIKQENFIYEYSNILWQRYI